MKALISGYRCLIRGGGFLLPVVLLLMRLGFGFDLCYTAHGHLQNFDAMVAHFHDWGIPYPAFSVRMSATTEMVVGILWITGFATRLISIPSLINFCVAYLTASHDKVIHVFHNLDSLDDFVEDSAFPFLMFSLLMIAIGPGLLSIDGLLKKTVFGKNDPPLLDKSQN